MLGAYNCAKRVVCVKMMVKACKSEQNWATLQPKTTFCQNTRCNIWVTYCNNTPTVLQ